MTLMDSAMGLAFVTTLVEPVGWTTLEVKANFTRAITVDTGRIRCTGSVIHPGRRVVETEARLEDAEDRLSPTGRARSWCSEIERGTLRAMGRDGKGISLSPVPGRRRSA